MINDRLHQKQVTLNFIGSFNNKPCHILLSKMKSMIHPFHQKYSEHDKIDANFIIQNLSLL